MCKRFRCGLLTLSKDGTAKKVDLANGGGFRLCDWHNKSMSLTDVRHLLLNIFKLDDAKLQTSLYDFKLDPLNLEQYETFYEYIQQNGLNCASAVVYICTHEANTNDATRKSMATNERKPKMTTSTISLISKQETSVQTTTKISTTSTEYQHVVEDEQDFDEEQIDNSLRDYSFKKSISSIMRNVCDLVSQNSFDADLIKLFENTSIVYGYTCLTMDSLKEHLRQSKINFQLIDQSDIAMHTNCFNRIFSISELIRSLLKQKKHKFSHIQLYSTIRVIFDEFYEKLKVIHSKWFKFVKENEEAYQRVSSFIQPTELETSTASHSNIKFLSWDKFKNKKKEKRSTNKRRNVDTLQRMLKCARELLDIMHDPSLSTLRATIQSIIADIESIRLTVNMNDCSSISGAKQTMISIKRQYSQKIINDAFASPLYQITRPVKQAFEKTFTAIYELEKDLKYTQLRQVKMRQNDERNRLRSYPRSSRGMEDRQSSQSLQRESETSHGNIEPLSFANERSL
ncbi:unnamed protein product [Rotaria magnacalcarata]|uniref:Uncharacterized protein n=1 Tax=Rotaria magnacalcarata TaxID=392030 RepID=A0A816V9D0_9BILA|nr:unnamed protein product [Rotaria magnacalcarata]CAF2201306.1 unnamed protein product [Rotaria magnacalcarata]CAF4022926.1 unnamed protein product [Rotaria magnacalcarata]CAF4138955.1 unnamed protein product [Rotaria magnacalcarata]